jgi:hypothetical protein
MLREKCFYTVKTVREVEQPNGKIKKVSESYLVEAISVTDAEVKIQTHLKDEPFDWSVKTVSETKILEVIR